MLPSPSISLPPKIRSVLGFTLAEKMIIVAIVGIVASISAPGVWGMLNRAKLKQTVAEVRTALNETQREAIKGNKICTVTLNFVEGKVTGSCLKTGDRNLASDVSIVTNLTSNSSNPTTHKGGMVVSDSQPLQGVSNGVSPSLVAFSDSRDQEQPVSKAGMIVQVIASAPDPEGELLGTSSVSSYDIPIQFGVLGNPDFSIVRDGSVLADPSGKIVFYFPDDDQAKKHCLAISNTLGLTRVGTYTGEITPLAITTSGRCIAEKWDQQ